MVSGANFTGMTFSLAPRIQSKTMVEREGYRTLDPGIVKAPAYLSRFP
jgi:hypothetical protein